METNSNVIGAIKAYKNKGNNYSNIVISVDIIFNNFPIFNSVRVHELSLIILQYTQLISSILHFDENISA